MWSAVILALCVTVCVADIPVTPPIRCGEIPSGIYSCIGNPKVIKPETSAKCDKSVTKCDKITCTFRKSGFLTDGKVDKQKVIAHFDQYAKENPEWVLAVQHAKANCLTTDIAPQGVFTDCPAYDITMCTMSSFIKNAQPSQWSTAPNCQYSRQFAESCPVCPSDCFAPLVPVGSCNACISLPRSP